MYYFRKNLLIKKEDRLPEGEIKKEILSIKLREFNILFIFKREIEQYLSSKFPDYNFAIEHKSESSSVENPDKSFSSLKVTEDYIEITNFINTRKVPNVFLINVEGYRNIIIGNERSYKSYHMGLKLVQEDKLFKFTEMEECYKSTEEINHERYNRTS